MYWSEFTKMFAKTSLKSEKEHLHNKRGGSLYRACIRYLRMYAVD